MASIKLSPASNGGEGFRPPRLPRWTRQEILALIQGKREVESRGRGRASTSAAAVEPKWAAVSAYCRRQGVNRGALQCRKRWSNLAGDFKKIKEWEMRRGEDGDLECYWAMRNDLRRERKLPGFFDRDVFEILDGASTVVAALAEGIAETTVRGGEGDVEEVVFDSGRSAADDGLFSDFEEEKAAEEEVDSEMEMAAASPVEVVPISEKKLEQCQGEDSNPDLSKDKQQQTAAENSFKYSPDRERRKRRRTSHEDDGDSSSFHSELVEMLDRNNRILAGQLQTQNVNTELDREQRKDQVNGLLGVLNKLADALGRIADKL